MELTKLFGIKTAEKIKKSGINIFQCLDSEIEYIAGKKAAEKIKAVKNLILSKDYKNEIVIKRSSHVYDIFKDMQFLDHEQFEVLALNRTNKVIERILISIGGVSFVLVDMKILFKRLLLSGASNFILVHNHPSGSLVISQEDLDITRKINEASMLLDLKLCDHVIIAGNSFKSFADEGIL